jgi:hypothetical protein
LDLKNLWGDSSIPDIQLVEYVLPGSEEKLPIVWKRANITPIPKNTRA